MIGYNYFHLTEPTRGYNTLIWLNDLISAHQTLRVIIPYTADIFVFIFPIFLAFLYIKGITKKSIEDKIVALFIFFSGILSLGLNLFIQYFADKQRPEGYIHHAGNLILSHIPDKSFPSDHVSLSMAIAVATLLWGIKNKNKFFVKFGYFFLATTLIMAISRVSVGVHRPTDVLASMVIGILPALLLNSKNIFGLTKRYIYTPIITLEEIILKRFKKSKE
ncbi:MAG: phosphatase PAP2 family protein [Candidatus Absconditabacteria bacterium]